MGKRKREGVFAVAAAALVSLVFSCAAMAYPSTAPNSHDFGLLTTGSTSAPFTFTLTDRCLEDPPNPGTCQSNYPLTPHVTVTGDFAIQNDGCTSPMPGDTVFGTSCTFKVVFSPTGIGPRSGIVDVGDPIGFAMASVTGTGTAIAASIPVPGPVVPVSPTKKCKKHRSASAAKKRCKKKRRAV
jgi:hypothetical protein